MSKEYYTINEMMKILQKNTLLSQCHVETLAEFLDEYAFDTVEALGKAITIISKGKSFE